MGKSISYCYKCSSLLRADDFEKGKAYQDGDRVVCARCAPQLGDTTKTRVPKSTTTIRPSRKITGAATERFQVQPAPPSRLRLPLILGACGGLVVVIVLIIVLVSSGRKEPPPAPPPGLPP